MPVILHDLLDAGYAVSEEDIVKAHNVTKSLRGQCGRELKIIDDLGHGALAMGHMLISYFDVEFTYLKPVVITATGCGDLAPKASRGEARPFLSFCGDIPDTMTVLPANHMWLLFRHRPDREDRFGGKFKTGTVDASSDCSSISSSSSGGDNITDDGTTVAPACATIAKSWPTCTQLSR